MFEFGHFSGAFHQFVEPVIGLEQKVHGMLIAFVNDWLRDQRVDDVDDTT